MAISLCNDYEAECTRMPFSLEFTRIYVGNVLGVCSFIFSVSPQLVKTTDCNVIESVLSVSKSMSVEIFCFLLTV